jgi:predicted short-subunit dehydrogenase-like oxidoreductase (DUF2520 family)
VARSVTVIGRGNWGSSLAYALATTDVPIQERDADIVWLCVPDAAIAGVARRLARQDLAGRIVVHSSGALSSEILAPARQAGAAIASVHPMMSFATRRPVPLDGVPFAVEAEAGARRIINALVRRIGGRPFSVTAEHKALYHTLGVLASPLLVSHLVAAQEAAVQAGFTRRKAQELIEPIVRATVNNFFARGAARSFSGPFARGDAETIRLHLQALQPHPMVAGVYRSLALYALDALPAPGKRRLRRLLRQPREKLLQGANGWRKT